MLRQRMIGAFQIRHIPDTKDIPRLIIWRCTEGEQAIFLRAVGCETRVLDALRQLQLRRQRAQQMHVLEQAQEVRRGEAILRICAECAA